MTFGLNNRIIELIYNEFKHVSEIEKVIIFGSRVLGNYKNGSDIDLALFGKNLNFKVLQKLKRRFSNELPIAHEIDLLIFDQISNENLKEHILNLGKVFYQKDES